MNPTSYRLAVSMAACNIAGAVAYTHQRESNYVEEDVRYYAHDLKDRNVEPVVYRVNMDQGGSAVQITMRVKGHPVKVIVDSGVSVSIITLPIVK